MNAQLSKCRLEKFKRYITEYQGLKCSAELEHGVCVLECSRSKQGLELEMVSTS